MNKKYVNILLIIFLLIILVIIFTKFTIVSQSVIASTSLFLTRVFPFLFIMMIINDLLISFNFPYYLYKITKSVSIYVFIMAILGGSPLNGIMLKKLLENKNITEEAASKIICYTTLNNPLFLYNYFTLIFANSKVTAILFIAIYLSNVLLFLIFKPDIPQKTIHYIPCSFQHALTKAIKNSTLNMLSIFGTIVFFKLFSDLLLHSNYPVSLLLKGLIEITQGLNLLVNNNLATFSKAILSLIIISFGGFSIHIQLSNILNEFNINYRYFYISRILAIIFSLVILSILYSYM